MIATAGLLTAGPEKTGKDKAKAPQESERRIDYTLEGLQHAMDLWYDATLKEDEKLAARYVVLIHNILDEDCRATRLACDKLERRRGNSEWAHAKNEYRKELKRLQQVAEEKEKLAGEIRKTGEFAEKYRRLGGYINKLRTELGMPKVQFADVAKVANKAKRN